MATDPSVGQLGGPPDDQFAADFAEAQRLMSEGDTEGLRMMASRAAAKRAADAAARAREDRDA